MLQRAFLEVVENQLHDGKPPETRATLDRLRSLGYTDRAARKLIACVVAATVWRIHAGGRKYDHASYLRDLEALPRLPED